MVLSTVFDWYEEDFKPNPLEWIRARVPTVPGDANVSIRPWDWSLNRQTAAPATPRPR